MEIDLSESQVEEAYAIPALYRSKCAGCGETIEEGDMIMRIKDGDWVHEDCA